MHFSCKIKKFYEGMQVYAHLLEDEKAIHIPFALSFTVTIATINGQLKTYLLDLENKVCQEIPDIDFDLMTDIYNIMSPKLKHDMAAFGNKTIRQILEELFGEQLDKTPAEMYNYIFDNTLLMTEHLKKIRKELDHAEPMLFEGYVCRHIREHNWDDIDEGYLKWKQKHSEITFEMLLEKQEQELQRYLERGIMRFAQKPSKNKMGEVDYDWHKGHLDCDFVDSEEYKKVYTQIMQFATRKDGMLTIDLKKYGKYIFVNYYKFSEGQKVALFELCVILDLIHQDMAQFVPSNHIIDVTTLPEILATPEAMRLWEMAQKAGYVDEHFLPICSRPEAAILADVMAERLGIVEKWKVFEAFWKRNNMRSDFSRAASQPRSIEFRKKIEHLFCSL